MDVPYEFKQLSMYYAFYDIEGNIESSYSNGPSDIVSFVKLTANQYVTDLTITVFPTEVRFGVNETSTKTVAVTTNLYNYDVTYFDAYGPNSNSWFTFYKQGKLIYFSPKSANTSPVERCGCVMIEGGVFSGSAVRFADACQDGTGTWPSNTLSVSPTSVRFEADETAAKTVTVTTNASSWNATTTASWLTLSQQGNTLRITPKSLNTDVSQRTATIAFTAGTASPVNAQVTQASSVTSEGLKFNDIVNSTYTATATPPAGFTNPAPSSWSGSLTVYHSDSYYRITNWANIGDNIPLWIDFADGKLYLDNYSIVGSSDEVDYYFAVGYVEGTTFTYKATTYKYEVSYNKTTRTLDFTGTIDGRTATVALIEINKTTKLVRFYTDTTLANAKFVLTPVSGAPASPRSAAFSGKSGKRGNLPGGKISVEDNIFIK